MNEEIIKVLKGIKEQIEGTSLFLTTNPNPYHPGENLKKAEGMDYTIMLINRKIEELGGTY